MTDEPLLTIASLEFLIPIASVEDPVNSMQHQMDVNALSSTRCLDGNDSENEAPLNETSKGFNVIDLMKSKVEEVCPEVVSCADILVLAARESIVMVILSYALSLSLSPYSVLFHPPDLSVKDELSRIRESFSSRGFDEGETDTLLGCDGSVLLGAFDGNDSEKEPPPNETLIGFVVIDLIKLELEEVCPGVASCADILFLAA
ncbi:hypothetical protein Ancab_012156 [Ancistrocladus abbreviatus]